MDTNLGKVTLTEIQKSNMGFMEVPSPFKGFCAWPDGTVIGVSETEPTANQKAEAVSALQALPMEKVRALYESEFDFDVLTGRLNQVLSAETLFKLRHEVAPMREYLVKWKNFAGVKAMLDALVNLDTATPEEYAQVASCFMEQGIDLEDYA